MKTLRAAIETSDSAPPTETAMPVDYEEELAARLAVVLELWWSPRFRRMLLEGAGESLGTTESRLLWQLARRGPARPGVLAAEFEIGAPAVTKAVARLRARSLATTSPDPADRRATLVSLTPDGRIVASRLHRLGDDMIRRLTAQWSPGDVRTLTALVARLGTDAQAFVVDLGDA